jgi:hypothetical protein
MVVSLYVCEIPNNITREDIEHVFSEIEGYLETRTKIANDKRTIAFIDYQTEQDAKCARETLQGFKFSAQDKGLIIKISDNTKGGQSQNFYNKNTSSTQNRNLTRKRNRSNSSSMSRGENNNMNGVVTSSSSQQQQQQVVTQQQQQQAAQPPSTQQQQQIELNNILSTLSSTQQQQPHLLQHGYHNPLFTNPNLLKILNEQQTALSPLGASGVVNKNDNNTTQQQQQQMPLQNQQQLINSLQTLKMLYDQINKGSNTNNNNAYSSNNSNNKTHIQQQGSYKGFVEDFEKYDEDIKSYEHFSANATKIVYVEGIPYDAHEREIAHIFRPFPGFQGIRIIPKEKNGKKTIICFIDFENVIQSTLCIQTLQGYRFDKNDSIGLHFSYGVSKNNKK